MEVELEQYNTFVQDTLHLDTNVPFDELEDDISASAGSKNTHRSDVSISSSNVYEEILAFPKSQPYYLTSHRTPPTPYKNHNRSDPKIRLIARIKQKNSFMMDQIFTDFHEMEGDCEVGNVNDDDDDMSTVNDVVSQDNAFHLILPPHLHVPISMIHPTSNYKNNSKTRMQSGYYQIQFDHKDDDFLHEESFELEYVGKNYEDKHDDDDKQSQRGNEAESNAGEGIETKCSCIIS